MEAPPISSLVPPGLTRATPPNADGLRSEDPAKVKSAAREFEALLLEQVLRTAHEARSGWLGQEDSAGECATDFAEQQLARALAEKGGIGIAALIEQGLNRSAGGQS